MVIMDTKPKRINVYKTMMRRRAFTKWVNLLLGSRNKQIVDIFDAHERDLLDLLLDIVLRKSQKKFKDTTEETRIKQREVICYKAESFKKNYYKENQDVNRLIVIQFIWDLIEYFHISPRKQLWEKENATMNAKEVLLTWLNCKLEGRNVSNFTTDWNDGIVLCELVNALEPGLLSPKIYLQGSWPHRSVAIAMETAEKAWGIPEIVSPDDMISSEVDELSVMTYVSLLFEYDLQRLSTNRSSHMTNGHSEITSWKGDSENGHFPEKITKSSSSIHETGEKKPEIGKLGKVKEYILNLHDVNANEITVSVEYKPTGKLKQDYKPDLKVVSLGKGKFRVKYTPNVAGNYKLSMFYKGEHIADSPYCLKVPPLKYTTGVENGNTDANNNVGKNPHENASSYIPNGTDGPEQLITKGGFYGFDGDGLRRATVGKLATFTVITDNRDKGPLSVCINCPAISIPVPYVKTTNSLNYSTHTISYMPTLAGLYNIYVRWGLKLINGTPFQVEVADHEVSKPRSVQGRKEYDKKRESTEFSHIKVYYSSSSLDPNAIRDTAKLEELLGRYGLTKVNCGDVWISIDVELRKDERDLVFRLAGTRKLPLVFINEKCLGGFEEVCNLDKNNELEKNLKYKIRKV